LLLPVIKIVKIFDSKGGVERELTVSVTQREGIELTMTLENDQASRATIFAIAFPAVN